MACKKKSDLNWGSKRLYRLVKNSLYVAWKGEVLSLAQKLLQKDDHSFHPYVFLDLPMGGKRIQNFLFVTCPELSREVLHDDASPNHPTSRFDRGYVTKVFRDELGETLFTAETEKHQLLRKSVSQYFRQHLDSRFGENLYASTNALIDSWLEKQSAPINVSEELPFFTSKAIIDNFIGEVSDPRALHEAMQMIIRNMERHFHLKRPFPRKQMQQANRVLREIAASSVQLAQDKPSLLREMAEQKDQSGNPLFEIAEIEAMARFLFLAGQETVSSVLPALTYFCKPEFQQEIRNEWLKSNREIASVEAVVEFALKSRWVTAIINECLRLFPPAYALNRESRYDLTIGDVNIPKGCAVTLFILFFQQDSAYWGKDAGEFNPRRWFEEKNKAPFMPFGIGPNHCLGQPFSRLEIGIFLTLFCLRCAWEPVNRSFQYHTRFSLTSKDPVYLSIRNLN